MIRQDSTAHGRELLYSTFKGARDPVWVGDGGWWQDVRMRMVTPAEVAEGTDKLSLPAWSPALYDGDKRSKAGAVSLDFLVLDYDDGTPIREAIARWRRWPGALHTSWSHTANKPKFRVVLPLREPVAADVWPRAWRWAMRWSGGNIDPACKDPSRIYFLPALSPSRAATYYATLWSLDRPSLRIPWESVPAEAPRPAPLRPSRGEHYNPVAAQNVALRVPELRRKMAEAVGATIHGDRATGARCPACTRPSVWWLINPERRYRAACNHRNTCGWMGGLEELRYV